MRTDAVRSNIAPSRPITVRDPVFSTGCPPVREAAEAGMRVTLPGTSRVIGGSGGGGLELRPAGRAICPSTRSRKTTALRPFASTSSK